jgi:uncharacterized protein YjbI with pentapeptide repeats
MNDDVATVAKELNEFKESKKHFGLKGCRTSISFKMLFSALVGIFIGSSASAYDETDVWNFIREGKCEGCDLSGFDFQPRNTDQLTKQLTTLSNMQKPLFAKKANYPGCICDQSCPPELNLPDEALLYVCPDDNGSEDLIELSLIDFLQDYSSDLDMWIFLKNIRPELTDFRKSRLKGVDLSNANLTGVDLTESQLGGADLRNADLSETILDGSYISCLRIRNRTRPDQEPLINIRLPWIGCANLEGVDLSNAKVRNADLRDVNLRNANLRGADLFGTKMEGVELCNTTMPDGQINYKDC